MRPIILLFLFLFLFPFTGKGQSSHQNASAEDSFFPDGVYLTLNQLKERKPGIKPDQLQLRNDKTISVRQWFRNDSLWYINDFGKKNTIQPDAIYAYADGGDLYIQRKGYGHKFSIIGNLCYFTESYPIRNAPLSPVTIDHAKDVIPRMLYLKSGEFFAFSISSMEEFLKEHDAELYDEYRAIDNLKHKRLLIVRYIEKFNERHPLNASTGL